MEAKRYRDIEEVGATNQAPVGTRIRKLRESRELSLRGLSERSGVSVNAISRIERGETSPTVSSLHRLATALSVQISEFFESGTEHTIIQVRKTRRRRTRGEGVLIESLGNGLPGQRLEPFLMTLLPGARSGEEPVTHGGEEFVFCVAGEVEYVIEREPYRLEEGDSVLFQANQSHLCRNTGLEKAVVLFVIQASDEDIRLSQQQHLMVMSD